MANRHMLAITDLDNFKKWLIKEGWVIENTKGYYEVLRARHPKYKYPLIVHKKSSAKVHCSIDERQMWIYKKYFAEKGEIKNEH